MTRKLSIQNFLFALIVGVAIGITPVYTFATVLGGYVNNIVGAEVYVSAKRTDGTWHNTRQTEEGYYWFKLEEPIEGGYCVKVISFKIAGVQFRGFPEAFAIGADQDQEEEYIEVNLDVTQDYPSNPCFDTKTTIR